MAFNVSKNQPTTFSEARNEDESVNSVTTHLYLRSSSSADHHASKSLDKDVVLRRIRHHKSLYKLRSTFRALISTSDDKTSPERAGDTVSGYRQMWLQQGDAFSAP